MYKHETHKLCSLNHCLYAPSHKCFCTYKGIRNSQRNAYAIKHNKSNQNDKPSEFKLHINLYTNI